MTNSKKCQYTIEKYFDAREKLELCQSLKAIFMNDKTYYDYNGKTSLNRFGIAPKKGERWLTPGEIVGYLLAKMGYHSPYDVPDVGIQSDEDLPHIAW